VTAAVGEPAVRTYGNWRRPSTPGLPRLGLLGTGAALGSVVVVMVVQVSAGLVPAAGTAAGAVVLVLPLACRDRAGRNGWQLLLARLAWALGRARGQDLYLAAVAHGPVAFGAARLPGLLARAELTGALAADGAEFAVVGLPSAGGRQYAVLVRCDPDGAQLVDPETVDEWVATWGGWLARLGHEPGLVAVSVTVQTTPDPGTRLAAEVRELTVAGAPPLARAVLAEAAQHYPVGAAVTEVWVALTFTAGRPGGGRPRPTGEVLAQLGRRLPALVQGLHGTGAGACRPLRAPEVTALVRSAYDPAAGRVAFPAAGGGSGGPGWTGWEDAGPVAQVEAPDHLRHDGAASVTWQLVEPPRGAVASRVLEGLLQADPVLAAKRVTLVYRPHDPAAAARVADTDVRTALGQAAARRGETRAGETHALAAARQSAAEHAAGAGLVRFALLVTATVAEPGRLGLAADVVEQAAAGCQLRLRRCRYGQSAAFAAALGVGVVLPRHVRVPELLRDSL